MASSLHERWRREGRPLEDLAWLPERGVFAAGNVEKLEVVAIFDDGGDDPAGERAKPVEVDDARWGVDWVELEVVACCVVAKTFGALNRGLQAAGVGEHGVGVKALAGLWVPPPGEMFLGAKEILEFAAIGTEGKEALEFAGVSGEEV